MYKVWDTSGKVLKELHREVLRPQVVRDIEEARAHGDISENAEFESAKDRQSHIEGRTRDLQAGQGCVGAKRGNDQSRCKPHPQFWRNAKPIGLF